MELCTRTSSARLPIASLVHDTVWTETPSSDSYYYCHYHTGSLLLSDHTGHTDTSTIVTVRPVCVG